MRTTARFLVWIGAAFFALGGWTHGYASFYTRYENLGNPTEYVFNAPETQVTKVLTELTGTRLGTLIVGGAPEEGFRLLLLETYTNRYWRGRREQDGEVDPPEAGKIGPISGHFDVRIIAKGATQTAVAISVKDLVQQVGRHYVIFPHFHKTGKRVAVPSDTYFEYVFLLKLGERLGEKNMPLLKGDGKDDESGG